MPVISVVLGVVAAGCLVAAAAACGQARLARRGCLVVFLLALAVWNGGYALEIAVPGSGAKVFWAKVQYVGIAASPLAMWAFAMDYTGRGHWTRPARIAALAVPPVATLALAWTNEAHRLIWADIGDRQDVGEALVLTHGAAFYLYWLYSYLLLLTASAVLIRQQASLHRYHRRQSTAVILALATPWACNAVYVLAGTTVDLTTIGFAVTGVTLCAACGRWGLLTAPPVARALVVEHMRDGMLVIDHGGRVVDCNPAAVVALSCTADDAVGRPAAEVLPPQLMALRDATDELPVVQLSDRCYEVARMDLPVHGGRCGRLLLLHDVTAREELQAHLSAAAMSDPLTGLANRRLFLTRVAAALEQRRDGGQLGVLLVDLDGFKAVNDRFGHGVGDDLLVATARRLEECVRPGDCTARLGGDEFAVLLPDVANEIDVQVAAERIATALGAPLTVDGQRLAVGASVGVHVSPASTHTPASLVQEADRAMYRVKGARARSGPGQSIPRQRGQRRTDRSSESVARGTCTHDLSVEVTYDEDPAQVAARP